MAKKKNPLNGHDKSILPSKTGNPFESDEATGTSEAAALPEDNGDVKPKDLTLEDLMLIFSSEPGNAAMPTNDVAVTTPREYSRLPKSTSQPVNKTLPLRQKNSGISMNIWVSVGFAILASLGGLAISFWAQSNTSILIPLLVIVGLAGLPIIVARPRLGLLAMVAMIYTRLSFVLINFHGAPSIFKIFLAFIGVVIFLSWLIYKEEYKHIGFAAILLVVYGTMVAASLLYAGDFSRALDGFEPLAKNIAVTLVVVALLRRGETYKNVIWVMLICGIFLGSLGVYQYFSGSFENNFGGFAQTSFSQIVGDTNDHRLSGPIGDPNFYAQTLVVLLPFAIDRLKHEKKTRNRLLALWALGMIVLSILLTFSRGGFLALVIMAAALLIYYRPKLPNLIIGVVAIVLLFQVLPPTVKTRVETLKYLLPGAQGNFLNDSSFRGRSSELIVGWMMFMDHPLFGVGFNNFPLFYQQYSRQLGIDPRSTERAAHNLYLQIAAETGLLGLTVSGLLLYIVLNGIFRAYKRFASVGQKEYAGMVAALLFGFFGYLTAALFIHDAYPRYFWLIVGIALAMPLVAKNETQSLDPIIEMHKKSLG